MAKKTVRRGLVLSAPKKSVFLISILLIVLGVASHFIKWDFLHTYDIDFWSSAAGGLLLIIGALFTGV